MAVNVYQNLKGLSKILKFIREDCQDPQGLVRDFHLMKTIENKTLQNENF